MKKILNVAVVGYGGMGGWHTEIISKIDELKLVGVYDILEERNQAAEKKGIHAYSSLDDLLKDDSVDLITIATPNDVHLEIALKCMDAGKNIVVEKPVAMNSDELQQMIDSSIKNNVLFTVHQNRRWDEDYLVVKKLYDENVLGRVFNIEGRVHGSRGIPGDWRNKKQHGGGMILDWGVHLFDQILQMFKDRKMISLYATLSTVTNEDVDDGFTVIFKYEDDLKVLIEVGTSNFINMPRWYIQGENGTAIIKDWDLTGEIVMVSDWEKRDAVPVVTAAGLTKTMAPRTEETIEKYPLPRIQSDIKDFYKNVRATIFDGADIIVKTDELMQSMKLMEAIFYSGENNKVVYFD